MLTDAHTERLTRLCKAAEWEAARYELPANWKDGRELVAGLAVDNDRTKDCDDAFAVDLVPGEDGIHHISVSFVDTGSFLTADKTPAIEAYARYKTQSTYYPHRNSLMIPSRLSEGIFSLRSDKDDPETPVITLSLDLLPDGTTQNIRLHRQRMISANLTYYDVDEMRNGEYGSDNAMFIRKYEEVANRLRLRRILGEGNVPITEDEAEYQTTPNRPARKPGEKIVSEFMLLANTLVPEFRLKNNIPGIFRNFKSSGSITMEQFKALMEGRVLPGAPPVFDRAYYSTTPEGHDALGLPVAYSHDSSPARRITDFANNANLAAFLQAREQGQEVVNYPYQNGKLDKIANDANNVNNKIYERRRLRRLANARPMGVRAVGASIKHPTAKAA